VSGGNIFAEVYRSGVYRSTDNGASWTAINSGLVNMDIQCIIVTDSSIFAGTNGAGVWKRPLSEITSARNILTQRHNAFNIRVTARAGGFVAVEFSLPKAGKAAIAVFDLAGRKIATIAEREFGQGLQKVSWDGGGLGKGVYVVKVRSGGMEGAKSEVVRRLVKTR
jgi:hypothetical protein